MQFFATNQTKMVVARSVQLTVKANTRTMKTLEGSLTWNRNGEKVTLSSRVAELDQMLPHHLGVPKAILDNVIFCHQDESLWPMSEPSVLKKKFDEIFESGKYIKAIENIKLMKKKKSENLKTLHAVEKGAKDRKTQGDKVSRNPAW